MLLEEVRFKRCRQNLNMCMGSGMWMVNIQLIRVFLDQAHEETLYISVTCDHEHHSNTKENCSLELRKMPWHLSLLSKAKVAICSW